MPKTLLLITVALILTGCDRPPAESKKQRRTLEERRAAVAAAVNKAPSQRIHQVDGGEVRVLEIPHAGTMGLIAEKRTCFVWRDREFRTATMACPSDLGEIQDKALERGQQSGPDDPGY